MSHKQRKKNAPKAAANASRQMGTAVAAGGPVAAGAPVLAHVVDDVEPEADSAAMPSWLFILLIVLSYWGMLHLDHYAGGFNAMVYGPYESYKELAGLQPKSGPEMLIAKGEAIYGLVCIACHQSTGLGSPGQYPPLAGSEWAQGPASRVIRIPLHGLSGPLKVNGQEWNASMPAFGGAPPLDNDENLAAVLTYVRQAWGNKAPPITPAQVTAVRAETASRTSQWTADELLKVPE
jgi:mono/diheme cytochrome c family protein